MLIQFDPTLPTWSSKWHIWSSFPASIYLQELCEIDYKRSSRKLPDGNGDSNMGLLVPHPVLLPLHSNGTTFVFVSGEVNILLLHPDFSTLVYRWVERESFQFMPKHAKTQRTDSRRSNGSSQNWKAANMFAFSTRGIFLNIRLFAENWTI